MQLNNVHFKRIVSVLTLLMAIGGFGAAHAIEAPDAVVALWFPPLGKDLSNFPEDSIEHAIWLIQRGEVNLAEGILERVKEQNRLGVTGMLVWQHLDLIRDTTVDFVPEHVADSLINSGLGLRFEEDIAAALKEQSSQYSPGRATSGDLC